MSMSMGNYPQISNVGNALGIKNGNDTITYPGGGVWSYKALAELLKKINEVSCDEAKEILKNDPKIQKAGNPTELAEALSDHLPKGIVLLPIYNKYGGNVTGTLMSIMDYYKKNKIMPRILGNVEVEIEHCLCGKPGLTEKQIKNSTIYSHGQAIKQCKEKIGKMGLKTYDVDGTSQILTEIKSMHPNLKDEEIYTQLGNNELLLLDKDTAKSHGLKIYDNQMGPEKNRTTFVVLTSDPKITLPKIEQNKNFDVGILKADHESGGLLLSLLPLILIEDDEEIFDLKAITSSLNLDLPTIGFVTNKPRLFNKAKGAYKHITGTETSNIGEMTDGTLNLLMKKLGAILRKNYKINIKQNKGNFYNIYSNNEPGALIKILILLKDKGINLTSIESKIEGNQVIIKVQTDNQDILSINEIIPNKEKTKIKNRLQEFIINNIKCRVHKIVTNCK